MHLDFIIKIPKIYCLYFKEELCLPKASVTLSWFCFVCLLSIIRLFGVIQILIDSDIKKTRPNKPDIGK